MMSAVHDDFGDVAVGGAPIFSGVLIRLMVMRGRSWALLLASLVWELCLAASASSAGFVPRHEAELKRTARLLGAEGKGILAADESTGTIAKRFASIGVENSEKTRRKYREMLFTTPGLEEHISGVRH